MLKSALNSEIVLESSQEISFIVEIKNALLELDITKAKQLYEKSKSSENRFECLNLFSLSYNNLKVKKPFHTQKEIPKILLDFYHSIIVDFNQDSFYQQNKHGKETILNFACDLISQQIDDQTEIFNIFIKEVKNIIFQITQKNLLKSKFSEELAFYQKYKNIYPSIHIIPFFQEQYDLLNIDKLIANHYALLMGQSSSDNLTLKNLFKFYSEILNDLGNFEDLDFPDKVVVLNFYIYLKSKHLTSETDNLNNFLNNIGLDVMAQYIKEIESSIIDLFQILKNKDLLDKGLNTDTDDVIKENFLQSTMLFLSIKHENFFNKIIANPTIRKNFLNLCKNYADYFPQHYDKDDNECDNPAMQLMEDNFYDNYELLNKLVSFLLKHLSSESDEFKEFIQAIRQNALMYCNQKIINDSFAEITNSKKTIFTADIQTINKEQLLPYFVSNLSENENNAKLLNDILITPGIDMNIEDDFGNTALSSLIRSQRFKLATMVVMAGIDLTKERKPLLLDSLKSDNIEFIELLIKKNVNINRGEYYCTPISKAAEKGCVEVVKLLIEAKVNLDLETDPIKKALKNGHLEVVALLLKYAIKCPSFNYKRPELFKSIADNPSMSNYIMQDICENLAEYSFEFYKDLEFIRLIKKYILNIDISNGIKLACIKKTIALYENYIGCIQNDDLITTLKDLKAIKICIQQKYKILLIDNSTQTDDNHFKPDLLLPSPKRQKLIENEK